MSNIEFCNMILKNIISSILITYTFLRVNNDNNYNIIKIIHFIIFNILFVISSSFFRLNINSSLSMYITTLISIIYLKIIYSKKFVNVMASFFISETVVYVTLYLACCIEYLLQIIFKCSISVSVHLYVTFAIQIMLVFCIFKIRRLKYGLEFLYQDDECNQIICLNIGIILLILYSMITIISKELVYEVLFCFSVVCIAMVVIIRKMITIKYKINLFRKREQANENKINELCDELEKLKDENIRLAKNNHKFYSIQNALKYKVEKSIADNEIIRNEKLNEALKYNENLLNENKNSILREGLMYEKIRLLLQEIDIVTTQHDEGLDSLLGDNKFTEEENLIIVKQNYEHNDIASSENSINSDLVNSNSDKSADKNGINMLNDLVNYFRHECTKQNIEFEYQYNNLCDSMLEDKKLSEDICIIIGDLIKNSIIAITSNSKIINIVDSDRKRMDGIHCNSKEQECINCITSKNKNLYDIDVMVENAYNEGMNLKKIKLDINIINKCMQISVFDSAPDFDENVIKKMGKNRITTHENSGGSGWGLVTLFEYAKKYKATVSLIEFEPTQKKERMYSKSMNIEFDQKSRFVLDSYRYGYRENKL